MDLQILKNNGSQQLFDATKISAGLMKSGASLDEAQEIASQVEGWASSVAVDGVIKSLEVREKVLELLQSLNPGAAEAYENYRKP